MPGTFSPPPLVSDPDMHHDTCLTHVPWCMPWSLTSDFLWNRWRGKRSQYSRRMRNPQFCVYGKRPMDQRPWNWMQHSSSKTHIGLTLVHIGLCRCCGWYNDRSSCWDIAIHTEDTGLGATLHLHIDLFNNYNHLGVVSYSDFYMWLPIQTANTTEKYWESPSKFSYLKNWNNKTVTRSKIKKIHIVYPHQLKYSG